MAQGHSGLQHTTLYYGRLDEYPLAPVKGPGEHAAAGPPYSVSLALAPPVAKPVC